MGKTLGYKGFDNNFKCQKHQFEVGKEYRHEGEVKLCSSGFHFCEYPLDVFGYYSAAGSKFAEVEAEGVSEEKSDDSKRVCKTLRIKAEITLRAMIEAAIKFTIDKVDWTKATENKEDKKGAQNSGYKGAASNSGYKGAASNSGSCGAASNSGYKGAASNSGYKGAASNSGYKGAASNSGDYGAASNSGKEGVAIALGIDARVKGIKDTWITLDEWKEIDGEWHRIDVQTVKVDGKKIKADTFYVLKGGKFVECKDNR